MIFVDKDGRGRHSSRPQSTNGITILSHIEARPNFKLRLEKQRLQASQCRVQLDCNGLTVTLKHDSLEGELFFWEESSYWTLNNRTQTEAWWKKSEECHQHPQWSSPIRDKPFEHWGQQPASSYLITIPRTFKEFWEELEFPSLSCNDGDWMNRSDDRELAQGC